MKIFMWAGAIGFYIQQNNYFGWHRRAMSDAELIADGITVLLFSLAAMTSIERKVKVNL